MLPFASSWVCKYGFSALTEIKSKKQEKLLGIDDKMWVCLTMMNSQKQALKFAEKVFKVNLFFSVHMLQIFLKFFVHCNMKKFENH